MPDPLRPMKASSGELPAGEGWAYEVKWDGMRAIVCVDGVHTTLTSSRGNDATTAYPELAGLGAALGVDSAVLDGEIVALDEHGRPSFGQLQHRMHVASARQAAERAATTPVVLFLFDLLVLDGQDLTGLPWWRRREVLEDLVEPSARWMVPPAHEDGRALLEAARAQGLEGVVAKRRDSTYRPGARTREWLKVKIRRRQEFVVGGWAGGEGSRAGRIGGLFVGHHDGVGGPLRFAGRVGSGLTEAEIQELTALLAPLVTPACPFEPPPPPLLHRGVTWVRPEIVVEVAYGEWTSEGRLRHPTYCGRRADKEPDEVTAEA